MHPKRLGALVSCLLVGLPAAAAPAGGELPKAAGAEKASAEPASAAEKAPKGADEDATLSLRFEVLQLRLSAQDVENVRHASPEVDVAALAKEVVKRGDAQIKYALGGPVARHGESSYRAGHRVPFVRSSALSESGERRSVVEYEDVGCVLQLSVRPAAKNPEFGVWATFQVEYAALLPESAIEIASDLTAPIFIQSKQSFDARITLGQDTYFWSLADLGTARKPGDEMLAHVYRIRFDPVEER